MKILLILILIFALACGGGGGSSQSASSQGQPNFKIELRSADVNRNKLVSLEDGAQFRIFSDLNDRSDPREATHVRVNILNFGGDLLFKQEQAIIRFEEPPYDVDPASRFVSIVNPPSGNITIQVQLGQDFGVTSSNTHSEVIYYSGQANIFLAGNVAFIDGQETDNIPIIIKNYIDEGAGVYSIQGYFDFSDFPVVVESVNDSVEAEIDAATATLIPDSNNFTSTDNISISNYSSSSIKIAELDEPLSYFFEILNISTNYQSFFVTGETGLPLEYVLRGYVSSNESMLGIPILVDWQTTWSKIMTDWFLNQVENNNQFTLTTYDYETNYLAMGNAFAHIKDAFVIPNTGNTISNPYLLTAQDLLLVELGFGMLEALNTGDKISDTSSAVRFDLKILGNALISLEGLEYFFFHLNKPNRVLLVDLENSDQTLMIPTTPDEMVILDLNGNPKLDSSGNLIIRESQTGELRLDQQFQSAIVDVSYNRDSLVHYLYKLMFE